MDADYYLETIETVFQEFKLVHGTWDVKNPKGKIERVRPQDITHTALLTVEGELDDISGAGQSEAAHKLCTALKPAQRAHYEAKGAGHYGIFSGRRWREKVYPVLHAFIQAHQKDVAPVKGAEQPKQASTRAVAPVKAKPVKAGAPAKVAKKAAPRKPVASKAAVETAAAPSVVKSKPAARKRAAPAKPAAAA